MDEKSLLENCLQAVSKHIERFSYAFNTSKDAVLKRNLEYLQFCFSDELQQIMSTVDNIKEECFPLLINKYMRELNLSMLDRLDGKTIAQMIAEVGEGLDTISFSTRRPFYQDPGFADIFPHLKNIRILNMEHTCNDEALKNIADHCPNLVELNIAYSIVTNEGLQRYLCQKDEVTQVPKLNLQKLNLDGTGVNDNQTALILKTFPELKVLNAPSMPCILHKMHQNNFSNLRKFKLTHLDTLFCPHLSSSPQILRLYALACPAVRSLKTVVTNCVQLDTLTTLTELKDVKLDCDELYSKPLINGFLYCAGSRLTVLKLDSFTLSVETLMECCPLLEELHLKNTVLLALKTEIVLREFKFLKKFYLESANFRRVGKPICAILSSVHKLEEIDFFSCIFFSDEIQDAVTKCCVRCPLKSVYFSDSDFSFSLLQSILLNSCTLKLLRVENPIWYTGRHTYQDNIEHLSEIASDAINKPIFEIEDEDNDLDAGHDLDIFSNVYREFNWGIN
ncbi:uncharacterized protein LOC129224104 [Uloborus diversus]|uniref:uncharacterized protein LOC129224104 n=1 Tax=Uloborus diversus TaxID=327109 RepID=UPI002409AB99|nr:uncharacterized protein LOC129224104 [Uloborus diversus]